MKYQFVIEIKKENKWTERTVNINGGVFEAAKKKAEKVLSTWFKNKQFESYGNLVFIGVK